MSQVTTEHGFPLIPFFDMDIIVTPSDIHLYEKVKLSKVLDKFVDPWQRINILDGLLI